MYREPSAFRILLTIHAVLGMDTDLLPKSQLFPRLERTERPGNEYAERRLLLQAHYTNRNNSQQDASPEIT